MLFMFSLGYLVIIVTTQSSKCVHACVITNRVRACVYVCASVGACVPQQAEEADSLHSVKARGFSRRRDAEETAEI